MANSSSSRQIILDDRFFLPPNVIDVRQEGNSNGELHYTGDVLAVTGNTGDPTGPVLSTPDSNVPLPPSNFRVVSQTTRVGSDGRTVVDVVFEFPDTPGIDYIRYSIAAI